MNNNTIYVGMDVHKESFTLRFFEMNMSEPSVAVTVPADYRQIINYVDTLKGTFGEEIHIVCGYEAGYLGYTLYNQLTDHNIECVILAPTTMAKTNNKQKNDKRDAGTIVKCLAFKTYSPVYVPTKQDDKVKEYIRMRSDHRLAFKKIKQQIQAFCLRHNLRHDGKRPWTIAHMEWLKSLEIEDIYKETLDEYLVSYRYLEDKIERIDKRIEELSLTEEYGESVKKLCCFMGIRTNTALSILSEVGDFKRFKNAGKFAAYLGLVPGENSSGEKHHNLSITKAGNSHLRMLLIEAAQCYGRGQIGYKSKVLKMRQEGNDPKVIAYADKANERLRRRFYHLILNKNLKHNVAKTAIARELACFIWGMMTNNIA